MSARWPVAPGLNEIGLMLPYSPLHHLLLQDFGGPLVATSGNVSGEPVITDPDDAEARLARCCSGFLHHDRPIWRPADDPVVRVIAGAARTLRLGRGSAPLKLRMPNRLRETAVACGGQLKATVAMGWRESAIMSPHIGDMGTLRSQRVFEQVIGDMQSLYGITGQNIRSSMMDTRISRRHVGPLGNRIAEGRFNITSPTHRRWLASTM